MKDLSEQTYYEVLELPPGCAAEALLKAYALARERYGPGSLATYALAEPGEAEALLRRVEEAFAVLSDPERRQAYDTAGGFASPVQERAPEQVPPPPPAEAASPQPAPLPPPSESAPVATDSAEVREPALAETGPEVKAAPESPPPAPEPEPEKIQESREEPVAGMVASAEQAEAAEDKPGPKPEQKAEPDHKPIRKTESDLPADSAVTGEALRRVREARGLTLKDVESRTKIGHWHLENIERERYADLPAQVYLRGFLMSFARELKLDPVRVARSYLEQMKAKPQTKPQAKAE